MARLPQTPEQLTLRTRLSDVYVLLFEANAAIRSAIEHAATIREKEGAHIRPAIRSTHSALQLAGSQVEHYLRALGAHPLPFGGRRRCSEPGCSNLMRLTDGRVQCVDCSTVYGRDGSVTEGGRR